MSSETIAVDIDEVLFPFAEQFIKHHNSTYGTDHIVEEFLTYEFQHIIQQDFEETVRRIFEVTEQECLHIEPIEHSVDAIKSLGSKYNLEIISARHPDHEKPIRSWIEKHYGNSFGGINFVGHPGYMESYRSKAEVCEDLGAIALVDDSALHVRTCAEKGIEGILFGNYPWNKTAELPADVSRCFDWVAVKEHFRA